MDLAERIRDQIIERLADLRWNRAELARKTLINPQTISEILHKDHPRVPRREARKAIERALDISLAVDEQDPEIQAAEQSRQTSPDSIQSYGSGHRFAPVIDLRVLEKLPMDLTDEQFLAEVWKNRHGRFPVQPDDESPFVIDLPDGLGPFAAGRVVTVDLAKKTAVHEEIVYVRLLKLDVRSLAEYREDDEGVATVRPFGGKATRDFEIIGVASWESRSLLKRPR